MKSQIISGLVTIGIVVGLILYLNNPRDAVHPADLVDALVDAGIQFSANQADTELRTYRKIVIATDINAVSANRTIKGLLLLDAIDSRAPIDLYIRTEGGWISDAFGIIDVMESIRAPVNTHAIGGTHSAGAMILAAGTGIRYGYPYSAIMFHAGLYEDDAPYSSDRIDNERLKRFWKRHARIPTEWITTRKEKTYFLGPEAALEMGLIDKIINDANLSDGGDKN
jgi:ATP-dependent Clp protease protease subunit